MVVVTLVSALAAAVILLLAGAELPTFGRVAQRWKTAWS
jgi:hypothetical protein